MKPTENYEQLLERFTKRTAQIKAKKDETQRESPQWAILESQLDYLRRVYRYYNLLTNR